MNSRFHLHEFTILTSQIENIMNQDFNFLNSRFYLHEFTTSSSRINYFNFTNSWFQLYDFNFTNSRFQLSDFNFTNSRFPPYEFNFTISTCYLLNCKVSSNRNNHTFAIKWAVSWQNLHNGFATSMDPDQHAHPRSLIRIHAVRLPSLLQVEKLIANSMDPD
jgi:hypothetical protein